MTLAQAMEARGIDRAHLAAALGVPEARVAGWLDGSRRVHPVYRGEFRRLLGMSRREFDALRKTATNRVVSGDKSRRRFPTSLSFSCAGEMRFAVLKIASRRNVTPSALLRDMVAEFLKGGADAGCQQCSGRRSPAPTRALDVRDARRGDRSKSLRPRRPLLNTTQNNQGDRK